MATMNLSLPDEMKAFIEAQVSREGYASASEYLLALIRDAQKRQARQDLETKLLEGLQGPAVEMTRGDWESIRSKAREELSGELVSLEDRLDAVADRESFVTFVRALAAEREDAERLERAEPVRYQLGGALNWQNGDISSFLWASLEYFESTRFHQPEDSPSWMMFAEFLYFGKIYK